MTQIPRRAFLAAAGAAVAPLVKGAKAVEAATPQGVSIEKDVAFGNLRLDVYRPPKDKQKRIGTIHLHGGGFTGGSKETLNARVSPLVGLGYTAVVSQYRLAGQAKWPAQLEDVKAAIRWTRANADTLGIDRDRLVVVGYSAGGFLALSAAATPESGLPLAACIVYYPQTDLRPGADGRAHTLMPEGSDAAAHRAASPTSHIGSAFPPTVIFQGTADTTVSLENSQRLFQQLRDAKVRAEIHTFEGQPHIFDNQPVFADACARLANLFLDRIVIAG